MENETTNAAPPSQEQASASVAEEVQSLAPRPDGAPAEVVPEEDDRPSLADDFDDLVQRIERAQNRIKGPSDFFVKKAGGGKGALATRDALADEVLQLMKEFAELCCDHAEGFEKLGRDIDAIDDDVRGQGRMLRDFVQGSAIAYALVLAQMVLTRPVVDDEMRRLAQEIIASMGAVQSAAVQQPPRPGDEVAHPGHASGDPTPTDEQVAALPTETDSAPPA